ncbi:MAG: site-2 protease family protein [Spirochaetales bacterium]|nr:site-2 protease family protein [Spirochaetales bacterium]
MGLQGITGILTRILITLPGVVIGLVFHEFMHAFTAWKLGDPTPREQGRITLNPLRHLDPVGFLFLLVAGFGWAKPVQINRNYMRHPRRDEVLVSLAGPGANLVLGVFFSILLRLYLLVFPDQLFAFFNQEGVISQIYMGIIILNYALCVFNLIPIPPLDGSHLIFAVIKVRPETEAKLYRYGTFFFLGLLVLSMVIGQLGGPNFLFIGIKIIVGSIANFFFNLLGFFPF